MSFSTPDFTQAPDFTPKIIKGRAGPLPIMYGGLSTVPLVYSSLSDQEQILRVISQVQAKYAVDPAFRRVALIIAQPVFDNQLALMRMNIINFVRAKMRYIPDPPGTEYLITPDKLLSDIRDLGYAAGDCDDHVVLLNTLLNAVGLQAFPVGVKLNGSPIFNHVISGWPGPDGGILLYDPCQKDGQMVSYPELLVL